MIGVVSNVLLPFIPADRAVTGEMQHLFKQNGGRLQNIQGQEMAITATHSWSSRRPWGEQNIITQCGIPTEGHSELSKKSRPLSYLLPKMRKWAMKLLSGGEICFNDRFWTTLQTLSRRTQGPKIAPWEGGEKKTHKKAHEKPKDLEHRLVVQAQWSRVVNRQSF